MLLSGMSVGGGRGTKEDWHALDNRPLNFTWDGPSKETFSASAVFGIFMQLPSSRRRSILHVFSMFRTV